MALVLFAVIGIAVGYRLELTRAGRIAMALTAAGSVLGQIALLFEAPSRASMTMLPLVVGFVLVLCMFGGAIIHGAIRQRRKT